MPRADLVHDNDTIPLIVPGEYPPELLAACKMWEVRPEQLLDWAVRADSVTMILPSGAKSRVHLSGPWSFPENGQERGPGERPPAKREKPDKPRGAMPGAK